MQRIQISVVRSRRLSSSDNFEVYGDGGSGEIDWVHPLTPRRQPLWPEAVSTAGHLLGGHVVSPHLDSVRRDGHLEGSHLADEHMLPAGPVLFVTAPLVFGRFRYAVVVEDIVGNAAEGGAVLFETVVSSEPPGPRDLRPVSFDVATRRLRFTFAKSERLVG